MELKADFHQVSICAQKGLEQKWHEFPYLAIDDVITLVLNCWSANWHTASNLIARSSKTTVQWKMEEAKLKME